MKVVSVALFGDGDQYGRYLGAFVRAHLNLFPRHEDWRLRVHVDPIVAAGAYGRILLNLEEAKLLEVRCIEPAILCRAMLWRMLPVFEKTQYVFDEEYVFCRDIDALPMPRDRACCDQFIVSKATVHTIHDHQLHVGIMGGLCGFRSQEFRQTTGFRSLDDVYNAAGQAPWGLKGADQVALNSLLLRPDGPTLLEHRYAGWLKGPHLHQGKTAGAYPNDSWSAPVPDGWMCNGSLSPLYAQADLLGDHLGCAGFDYEAATKFWDDHGDPRVTQHVAECEG